MKDQVDGQPILAAEEFAAGVLKTPDGRPVTAMSIYTGKPVDGRPTYAVSLLLSDGQIRQAVSFYANGILKTPDGRPVMACKLYDAVGAPAAGGTTLLGLVTLQQNPLPENAANGTLIGNLLNTTAGSTLTLTADAGGRVTVDSANRTLTYAGGGLDYETEQSFQVTVRETLAGATNTPRDSTLTIVVTNVLDAASLVALGGTFTLPEDAAAGAVAGALTGKTTGSTLSLVDTAGNRVALSGTNIVRGSVALDFEAAASHSFTVRETLADSPNSPRDTVLTLTVTDVFEGSALTAPVLTQTTAAGVNPIEWDSYCANWQVWDPATSSGDKHVMRWRRVNGGAWTTEAEQPLDTETLSLGFNWPLLEAAKPLAAGYFEAQEIRNRYVNGVLSAQSAWSNSIVDTLAAAAFAPSDLYGVSDIGYAWDPTNFANMWTDSGVTQVTAFDQTIGKLADLSGDANHLTSTNTERPLIKNLSNGLILFDGVNDILQSIGGLYAKGALTLIIAVRDTLANANNANFFWAETSTSSSAPVYAPGTRQNINSDVLNYQRNNANSAIANNMDVNCWDDTLKILTITDDGSNVKVSVNGGAFVTNAYTRNSPLSGNMSALGVARNAGGNFSPYAGYVGAGILVSRVLSGTLGTAGTEMTKAYNWIAAKHGLTQL